MLCLLQLDYLILYEFHFDIPKSEPKNSLEENHDFNNIAIYIFLGRFMEAFESYGKNFDFK